MVLEAAIVLLDNSEYSINGDYLPTRIEAQTDAAHTIFRHKVADNPETVVGLMVMGRTPQVLVSPTRQEGKLVGALQRDRLKKEGRVDLYTSLNVALLALNHRQNKNQRQRIVVFVASPLAEKEDVLERLGKRMRKNNVSLDIVLLDSEDAADSKSVNHALLSRLHAAVGAGDENRFVVIPPGTAAVGDRVLHSNILRGERPEFGDGFDIGMGDLGFDPEMDPELALAMRMSLEEEQQRQANAIAATRDNAAAEGENNAAQLLAQINEPQHHDDGAHESGDDVDDGEEEDDEDDPELALALALSRGDVPDDDNERHE